MVAAAEMHIDLLDGKKALCPVKDKSHLYGSRGAGCVHNLNVSIT